MNNRSLKVVISRLDSFRVPVNETKWFEGTEATKQAVGEKSDPKRWQFPPLPWREERYDYLDG